MSPGVMYLSLTETVCVAARSGISDSNRCDNSVSNSDIARGIQVLRGINDSATF